MPNPDQKPPPPVDASTQAEASSAHAQINVPINLEHWRHLPEEISNDLLWYHQHLIASKIGWDEAARSIGYDRSTVFRVLKGTYQGSYENVAERIRDYRKSLTQVKRSTFAPNRISRLIASALDYVVISEGIVEIIGESGQGKTVSGEDWMHRHNSGRTTMVEVPPTGGHKGFLRAMCARIGANRNQGIIHMEASIMRAYNPRRVLILDEAHRLLPADRRSNPTTVDFIRHLHDMTGVPIGILVTGRFDHVLRQSEYMFEQFLGRIDLQVKLPARMSEEDFRPMLEQFIPEPSPRLVGICEEVVNNWPGHMRALNKLLKFASRIATKADEELADKHVSHAIRWRDKLQRGDL